jgi:aspartyl-tRNA synthetase
MLLTKRTNLRETIAFPKTASATDLLCNAPSEVADKQLQDLFIASTAVKEEVNA